MEVGALLGAQQIVGGSVAKIGDIYTVSVRRIDIETGEILSVANYDHSGALEILLTEGMQEVAMRLSGNQGEERKIPDTVFISESVQRSVTSTDATSDVVYILVPIEIIRSTNGKLKGFDYDNTSLSRSRLKDILLSSNDKEIEDIVKRANRRFYAGTILGLAGGAAILGYLSVYSAGPPGGGGAPPNGSGSPTNGNDDDPKLSAPAAQIGFLAAFTGATLIVSRALRNKRVLAAVKRYNQIATQNQENRAGQGQQNQ